MIDYHNVEIAIDSKMWFILNDTPLHFLIYLHYPMLIIPLNHMDQISHYEGHSLCFMFIATMSYSSPQFFTA